MKILTVGEFKAHFSEVLNDVRNGREVGVSYGKKKELLGVFTPAPHKRKFKRKLGLLEGKATFKILPGFKMTDEEFLNS